MSKMWKKGILDALNGVLQPSGFKRKGVRFLRTLGPVMQVVSVHAIPNRDEAKWTFHLYEGVTTPSLAKVLFPQIDFVPEAEHGPFFVNARILHTANSQPYEVTDEASATSVAGAVVDLVRDHVLPHLNGLTLPSELVAYLESNLGKSVATRERTAQVLRTYRESFLTADSQESLTARGLE
jgi:hypothetical protein